MIFSQKLQVIRKNKGLTQEKLAGKLDVSRQTVARWESGYVYPDISNLIKISELFNVTVDYLVKDQEQRFLRNFFLPVRLILKLRKNGLMT